MSLARLWDNNRDAVSLKSIGNILKDKRVIEALVAEAAARMSASASLEADISSVLKGPVRDSIGARVTEAVALIDTYYSDDELRLALENLKILRVKVFAHRQRVEVVVPDKTATREQIERFMRDISKLIALLSSIAHATAYEPTETGQVYNRYAELFWASARGERTEGHPNFRLPPA